MGGEQAVKIWPLTCKEAAERAGVPWACCESCHQDAEFTYEGLIFEVNVGSAEAVVCCEMARAIEVV